MRKSIITTEATIEDKNQEPALRPQFFDEYIGQNKSIEQMKIFIEAAKNRQEALDHVLLYGPPGLGKTTLANIIANEMDVNLKVTSGPAIEKPGEIAAILSNLKQNDLLFIDEIHRLNRQVEEVLYPAMEDFAIDVMIGKGPMAKSIRIDLPKFTLVGATTRAGMLTSPLRDRFGVIHKLDFYSDKDLAEIVKRSSKVLGISVDDEAAYEIGRRSRGTPRIANRLLKRVRDFAQVKHEGIVDKDIANKILDELDVDKFGLDGIDRLILMTLIQKFEGKPTGIDTLSAAIGEDFSTIEDVYEPFLIQKGFLLKTPRGRVVSKAGYEHLGLKALYVEV